jgi:hypothetical protein
MYIYVSLMPTQIHKYIYCLANNNDKDETNRQATSFGDLLNMIQEMLCEFLKDKKDREDETGHLGEEWAMLDKRLSAIFNQPQGVALSNYLTECGCSAGGSSMPKVMSLFSHLHPVARQLIIQLDTVDRVRFVELQQILGVVHPPALPDGQACSKMITTTMLFPLVLKADTKPSLQLAFLQRGAGLYFGNLKKLRSSQSATAEPHRHDPAPFLQQTRSLMAELYKVKRALEDLHIAHHAFNAEPEGKAEMKVQEPFIKVRTHTHTHTHTHFVASP